MQDIPGGRGQIIPEPFLAFRQFVCAREIKTSDALRSCKSQVKVLARLGPPILLVGCNSSQKVVAPHSHLDKMLQHCCPKRIADFVRRELRIETFLQDRNCIVIAKTELSCGYYSVQFQK